MRHRQLTRVVVLINSDDYRADMKGDGEGWVARFFSRVNSKRAVVRANKRIQEEKKGTGNGTATSRQRFVFT